jgi:hypothetical protein
MNEAARVAFKLVAVDVSFHFDRWKCDVGENLEMLVGYNGQVPEHGWEEEKVNEKRFGLV